MIHMEEFAQEIEEGYGIKILRCLADEQAAELDENAQDFVWLEILLSPTQQDKMKQLLGEKQTTVENYLLQANFREYQKGSCALSNEYDIGYFLLKHNGFILYTHSAVIHSFMQMLQIAPDKFTKHPIDEARYKKRRQEIERRNQELLQLEQERLAAYELRAKELQSYLERREREMKQDAIVEIDEKLREYAAQMERDFNVRIVKCGYDEQANKSAVTARDLVRVTVWLTPEQKALVKKNQGVGGIDSKLISAFNIEEAKGNCFYDIEYEVGISFNTHYGLAIFTSKAVVPTYLSLLLEEK